MSSGQELRPGLIGNKNELSGVQASLNSLKHNPVELKKLNMRLYHVVDENDPNNPYGPNYFFLPNRTKVYYKFLSLCKYVHVERSDEEAMLNFNYFFYSGIFAATLAGFFISKSFFKLTLKPLRPKLYVMMESQYSTIMHTMISTIFGTYVYQRMNQYYSKAYVEPLTDKYLPLAINNGFQDYKVSDDK